MENFQLLTPTELVLQPGAETLIGQKALAFGRRALLVHYGVPFLYESGLYDRVTGSLKAARVDFWELSGVQPNPLIGLAGEGISLVKEHGVELVLGIGGGSVIDTVKAVAAGAMYEGDVWDLYTGKAVCASALPSGIVMTAASTGSEGSNGSVMTNEQTHEKRDVMSDCLRPAFVLINPELTYTLPPFQTACGVADMISHVMERYFTSSKDTLLLDELCEAAMRSMIELGRRVMKNPSDYNARAELMVASILGHNGLLGIGRNQDWSCHVMGAPISGVYNAVHAATLTALIPSWMEYVLPADPARFARFAKNVMGAADTGDDEQTAQAGVAALKAFYKELGMPLTLSALGVETSRFGELAQMAIGGGKIGSIRPVGAEEIEEILNLAY
ncbi:MAG TPA: iron-containing alcohol dehydrogenase [Feifaniaceae bacterium]|nr:iron-containing alcohol dehydrogenase [Feifaniaceae bacterium]